MKIYLNDLRIFEGLPLWPNYWKVDVVYIDENKLPVLSSPKP